MPQCVNACGFFNAARRVGADRDATAMTTMAIQAMGSAGTASGVHTKTIARSRSFRSPI
jgi:hypothetical protein